MPDKIIQSGNIVHGDQAAGSIYHTHLPPSPTFVSDLNRRLAEQTSSQPGTRLLVERLRHYTRSIDAGEPMGLRAKLAAGNLLHRYADAQRHKERFVKRLMELNLSEAAQDILTFAITRIHQRFEAFVAPLLRSRAPDSQIAAALFHDVVDPVMRELEINPLSLMPDEVSGMVWYLTANCFINWTP